MNNDGRADLLTASGTFLSQGNRQFRQISDNGLPITTGTAVGIGDFNGDKVADAVIGYPIQNPGNLIVAYGRGDGTFYLQSVLNGTMTPYETSNFACLAVADFNRDGFSDILTPILNSTHALLYTSDGQGRFQTSYVATGVQCQSMAVADLNRTGKMDAVILKYQPLIPPNVAVILAPR